MYIEGQKWTEGKRERTGERYEWRLEDMRNFLDRYDNDPHKGFRLQYHICKFCKYEQRVGMSAMTLSECGKCGVDIMNGSTDIDILCTECAKETNSCKHCGGPMD